MADRHVAICGGGSGGHLTPALAVAEQIRILDPTARVTFFTSGRAVDRRVIDGSGLSNDRQIEVVRLPILRMPQFSWNMIADSWRFLRSCQVARKHCAKNAVSVVLGTGGFASVPGLIAGSRIPTVLFEANVVPGRANRLFARRAKSRLVVWPTGDWTRDNMNGHDRIVVGMPLRREFRTISEPGPPDGNHRLLILGGSQGSRRLNQIMEEALRSLEIPAGWNVVHQTGSADEYDSSSDPRTTRVPFIDNMAATLRSASLVVSRAGAITLAELAATGRPAILVPLKSAGDDHQRHNAVYFANAGAAVVIDESDSSAGENICNLLRQLMTSDARRNKLARNMRKLDRPDGAADIARRLIELCQSQPNSKTC